MSEELQKIKSDSKLSLMSLYDMSKQIVAQLPVRATAAELEPCKKIIRKFKHLGYYMLLCREENDYTVVRVRKAKSQDKFEDLIIELLQSRGDIKDIDYDTDKQSLECWVQKDDKIMMYKLFPYSWGVIECQ